MARSAGTDRSSRDRPDEGNGGRWFRKFLSGAVGVTALVAFAGLLLHAYSEGRSSATGGATVVIKAEPGPFKVKPESPGGRATPDRDKRIYDRIQAAPTGEPVERLLPLPEAPLSLETLQAAEKDPPPTVTAPDSSEPRPKAETVPKAAAKATTPPAPPSAPAVERKYRLQLAALRSRAAAGKAWKRLRSQHRKLLSGLGLAIERKDLGPPKGVYYRLLAGPVSDRETARRLCAELSRRKVGCLVVQR